MAATQVINGFQCRNCTDIDYARKHIDPAHPKDGPYGVNAKNGQHADGTPVLSKSAMGDSTQPQPVPPGAPGGLLDLTV